MFTCWTSFIFKRPAILINQKQTHFSVRIALCSTSGSAGKVMEESDIRGMGERTVRVGKNDGIERLFVARQNG